jgi:hypothetical protein
MAFKENSGGAPSGSENRKNNTDCGFYCKTSASNSDVSASATLGVVLEAAAVCGLMSFGLLVERCQDESNIMRRHAAVLVRCIGGDGSFCFFSVLHIAVIAYCSACGLFEGPEFPSFESMSAKTGGPTPTCV